MEADGAVKCTVSLSLLRLAQMNWVAEYQTLSKELEGDVVESSSYHCLWKDALHLSWILAKFGF